MEQIMSTLNDLNYISIIFRLTLAIIAGGVIGLERELDSKFAGLRTHILVSFGAAIVMIINLHAVEQFPNANIDVNRLGAQVISGIGFLGAGTILVTPNKQISGLTTAAGLWTTAILGLSAGVGFYPLTIIGIVFILFIIFGLKTMKRLIHNRANQKEFTISVYSVDGIRRFIRFSVKNNVILNNLKIIEEFTYEGQRMVTNFMVTITLPNGLSKEEFISMINELNGVRLINVL